MCFLNQQMWVVLFGSAPFLLSTLTLDGASLNVDGCVVASHLFSCDASGCDLCSPLSICSSSLVFNVSPRFAQPCRLITLFSPGSIHAGVENVGTAFTFHHQRFCVSVSLFAPLWYRTAVSGAWFLSGGCHRLVMVGSWCTVLATHVHSCSFAVSLSRCCVVGSQVLPRCALLISCCLAPFALIPKSLLQTHCIIGVNVSKNQFLTPPASAL